MLLFYDSDFKNELFSHLHTIINVKTKAMAHLFDKFALQIVIYRYKMLGKFSTRLTEVLWNKIMTTLSQQLHYVNPFYVSIRIYFNTPNMLFHMQCKIP